MRQSRDPATTTTVMTRHCRVVFSGNDRRAATSNHLPAATASSPATAVYNGGIDWG
ncbi:hypothetical protein TIFTF001_013836 [Ficus carica]|uniref:Uncharacterized protein n=1 Tax=Ficus carica TaxID=3494 RepID=A0AA88D522_FICCA|nr:hypothetical protein TIFTF001_013836 [Ficus carica]